jgi:signal transduction histidine kinase
MYKSRQVQQKANNMLAKQNTEIQNQTEELRQINEELDKQTQQLATLNHTKDKLFAIVGHDLKSPINSLKGLLSLVTSQNVTPAEFVELTTHLQQNVEHIHFTMNNLLHWANAQMQGIETIPQKTALYELAQENIDLFENIAQNKQITLQHFILPEATVWADTDQINLVFRNLISNALKFTPKGGKISLQQQNGNDFYQISVTDTGIGISEEVQAKLFQPHTHLSTQGTAGEKGTGLGLLLCKDFIENNHGKIWVESQPKQGTTFHFTLPTLTS